MTWSAPADDWFPYTMLKSQDAEQWPHMIELLGLYSSTWDRNKKLGAQLFGTPDSESSISRWSWHAVGLWQRSYVRIWFRSQDDLTQFALMIER